MRTGFYELYFLGLSEAAWQSKSTSDCCCRPVCADSCSEKGLFSSDSSCNLLWINIVGFCRQCGSALRKVCLYVLFILYVYVTSGNFQPKCFFGVLTQLSFSLRNLKAWHHHVVTEDRWAGFVWTIKTRTDTRSRTVPFHVNVLIKMIHILFKIQVTDYTITEPAW